MIAYKHQTTAEKIIVYQAVIYKETWGCTYEFVISDFLLIWCFIFSNSGDRTRASDQSVREVRKFLCSDASFAGTFPFFWRLVLFEVWTSQIFRSLSMHILRMQCQLECTACTMNTSIAQLTILWSCYNTKCTTAYLSFFKSLSITRRSSTVTSKNESGSSPSKWMATV